MHGLSFYREDEDDITAFPVVKETGDKLIETGINTLQRTLLLKKEVEVDRVQAELEAKRHEFKERMEACSQRQIEIQKKQQKVVAVYSYIHLINTCTHFKSKLLFKNTHTQNKKTKLSDLGMTVILRQYVQQRITKL